jgi:hypothetical protein
MEAMAYVSHASGVPGASLFADGDLLLRQAWPLQVRYASDGWDHSLWAVVSSRVLAALAVVAVLSR